MKDFGGKVCVVTGAGSGIGRALSLDLAGRGARLALSDIDGERVEASRTACEQRGAREVLASRLDVSERAAVFKHADSVLERFGTVNLVVNNAGVALEGTVLDTTIEDYEWIMGINFWGVVYGCKAFLPHLIASRDGYVVNISSIFGIIAVPGQSGYHAAKFGVRGFTESLREEMLMAGHPVGVSCVHPGGVKTDIARAARSEIDERERVERFQQLARLTPEQAARIILKGVAARRARILVGNDARALDLLQRATGARYQELVWRVAKRADAQMR
ncbi:MAG TPA: SDR family NAD(P)-dependent oxidoreductase [Solirubrobacteraceae bacterium]|nr:SDR family NAD(P)-dependent oxidoreductase [Solirubrobacteraceae bacterium]